MAESRNDFMDLEAHWSRLEENIKKLRKSLQYWQTWEAEYEGLKEEILGLGNEATKQQLEVVRKGFGGALLNDKEIKDLFGGGFEATRNSEQVLGLLSRRIDYVQENVKSMEKQLNLANEKLMTATVLAKPEIQNDEGLPLIEIVEELDDDGNILSGSIKTTDDSTRQVADILQRADPQIASGKKNEKSTVELTKLASKSLDYSNPTGGGQVDSANVSIYPSEDSYKEVANFPKGGTVIEAVNQKKPLRKKSVTFSEDTKGSSSCSRQYVSIAEDQTKDESIEKTEQNRSTEEFMELKDTTDEHGDDISDPLTPSTDSPEDALLRKQMLKYSMNEVGAIVAEMDLNDTGSEFSDSDEDGDDQYDSADDEDEGSGRTTKPLINENYRKEMLELEQKLKAKMLQNVGAEPYKWVHNDRMRSRSSEIESREQETVDSSTIVKEKGVRFAEELDVPDPQRKNNTKFKSIMKSGIDDCLTVDAVIKQSESNDATNVIPNVSKKSSRFKSTHIQKERESTATKPDLISSDLQRRDPSANVSKRNTLAQDSPPNNARVLPESSPWPATSLRENHIRRVPEGPAGQIQSDTLVEHPPNSEPTQADLEPDELDPPLLHQEVAMHYHRMHNRMIQRKGGFTQRNEEEEEANLEDEGGRKMSRFKAARIGRLGK